MYTHVNVFAHTNMCMHVCTFSCLCVLTCEHMHVCMCTHGVNTIVHIQAEALREGEGSDSKQKVYKKEKKKNANAILDTLRDRIKKEKLKIEEKKRMELNKRKLELAASKERVKRMRADELEATKKRASKPLDEIKKTLSENVEFNQGLFGDKPLGDLRKINPSVKFKLPNKKVNIIDNYVRKSGISKIGQHGLESKLKTRLGITTAQKLHEAHVKGFNKKHGAKVQTNINSFMVDKRKNNPYSKKYKK